MSSSTVNLEATAAVSSVTGGHVPAVGPIELRTVDVDQRVQEQIRDLSALYPDPSPKLATAMALISEAVRNTVAAIEAAESDDQLKADNALLQVQAALPDLFRVREVGDGFRVVCAALLFAFENKNGSPFTKGQMYALLRAYKALWESPFMSAESAVAHTDVLEDSGLIVDPVLLTDIFSEAEEAGFVDG